ncbi:unnamed protein product (macronuclear) [Paramecium tetraurelia]|uniref:Ubiquitin carboxyl-terminal hydrolase n=1 Tax=Paramecium tetraurelia TaxID=5888 RepID=A0BFP8_PARTE|nr:uncharacterized protein GSPATT00028400001 [Paramecium tetraurelia]CAK57365.1 unnamed protein product [Paramecium tetraurelia]|eukprot:XP_001424763.1 hypothetical protein (macronuclear) [Paramecium tetraurelia strain d4-2]
MIKNKGYWVYGGALALALLGTFKYTMKSKQQKPTGQVEFSLLQSSITLDYNKKPAGIINNGNTCFLNSVLQWPQVHNPISLNTYLNQSQQICLELAKIMKYLNSDLEVINASDLIDLLSEDADYSFFYEQQDSHELFNMLMKHIEEANNQVNSFDLTMLRSKQMKSKNPFLHHTKVQIKCNTCNHSFNSLKVESNYAFHFNLNHARTVPEAIDYIQKPETITEYICLYCSLQFLRKKYTLTEQQNIIDSYFSANNYDEDSFTILKKIIEQLNTVQGNQVELDPQKACLKRTVTRQTYIAKYPKTFCFFVNRLIVHPYHGLIKLDDPVYLDSNFPIADKEFTLSALVCHLGDSKSGHYVAFKRTFAQDLESSMSLNKTYKKCEWYAISDVKVAVTKQPQQGEAYLIFYDTY